ncbi:PHA/PHB synthase family protein [Brevundimonas sp.]|uniref:PHA/PHB synthase family protein n=1 Tax=Brevundimonas sp. TaxID=1871086 RepID=UPI0035B4011D
MTATVADTRREPPIPTLPDPEVAAEALTRLAEVATAAARTAALKATSPEPLPYDPTTLARAVVEFNTAVMMNPAALVEAQAKNLGDWTALWRTTALRAWGMETEDVAAPARGDRRFSAAGWSEPAYDALKQAYLLAGRQIQDFIAAAPVGEDVRRQVDFLARQLTYALSPSNFAHTNPEVARRAVETGGMSLITGLTHLLEDVARGDGLVGRRAPNDFELGVNIAATPGAVVFQNRLMEVIQYAPATDKVHRRPLLFVPPLVNKFYLFDLTPKASYLKWLVDQGHTVFVVSWVNPDTSHADVGLDDYVIEGVVAAMDAVEQATGEPDLDLVAYCLGGTLAAMALAWLAGTGRAERVASATLIASLVDFSDIGEWAVFTGESDVKAFHRHLDHRGYIEGQALAQLFSTVRANDLIWSSVVQHYLMGDEARASDLLWWFDDAARMPARTLKEYSDQILRRNALSQPGALSIGDVALDLKAVKTPVTIIGFHDDHVSAWRATYAQRRHFGGAVNFLLGGSGHNAGMINPPAANKHGYWTNDATLESADDWLAGAEKKPGSWWPEWQAGLAGDKMVKARTVGSGKLKAGDPAPGAYVRVKH